MNLQVVVDEIRRAGGVLKLDAEESVRIMLPPGLESLLEVLREHKPELVELLHRAGGRIANFPRCPECGSYYLNREKNIGEYECLSCGAKEIDEGTARWLM